MGRPKLCRLKDCKRPLAKRNRTGFCAQCQQYRQAEVCKTDKSKAAARLAYWRAWRKRNVKLYGKTRPTKSQRKKAA
jgi:ribosomal protein L44E